jgi:hypothetical protein
MSLAIVGCRGRVSKGSRLDFPKNLSRPALPPTRLGLRRANAPDGNDRRRQKKNTFAFTCVSADTEICLQVEDRSLRSFQISSHFTHPPFSGRVCVHCAPAMNAKDAQQLVRRVEAENDAAPPGCD